MVEHNVGLRVSREEKREIRRRAKEAGLSVSEYLRRRALDEGASGVTRGERGADVPGTKRGA